MVEQDDQDRSMNRPWWVDALDPVENLRTLANVQDFGRLAAEELADRLLAGRDGDGAPTGTAASDAELDQPGPSLPGRGDPRRRHLGQLHRTLREPGRRPEPPSGATRAGAGSGPGGAGGGHARHGGDGGVLGPQHLGDRRPGRPPALRPAPVPPRPPAGGRRRPVRSRGRRSAPAPRQLRDRGALPRPARRGVGRLRLGHPGVEPARAVPAAAGDGEGGRRRSDRRPGPQHPDDLLASTSSAPRRRSNAASRAASRAGGCTSHWPTIPGEPGRVCVPRCASPPAAPTEVWRTTPWPRQRRSS